MKNGRKFAVVLTEKPTGDRAAIAKKADGVKMGTTLGSVPFDVDHCRVFPDRIRGSIDFVMWRLEVAIENYDPDGGGYLSKTFPKWMLEKALASLRDPAIFESMVLQLRRWSAIHELGHACGIKGHIAGGGESSEGDASCFMRYVDGDENKHNMLLQVLFRPSDPLPQGVVTFCRASDFNCFKQLDVHDH